MTGPTQREAVWRRDKGLCVGCGQRQALNARGLSGWSVHHVIKAQVLRRRRVPSRYLRGPDVCVVACQRCHERHESRTAPIPLERLPTAVITAADELGPWAQDLLRRYHPPTATGRHPANERTA